MSEKIETTGANSSKRTISIIGLISLSLFFLCVGWFVPFWRVLGDVFFGTAGVEHTLELLKILLVTVAPLVILLITIHTLYREPRIKLMIMGSLVLLCLTLGAVNVEWMNPFLYFFNIPSEMYQHYQVETAENEYEELTNLYYKQDEDLIIGEVFYVTSNISPQYNDLVVPVDFFAPETGEYSIYIHIESERDQRRMAASAFEESQVLNQGENRVYAKFDGEYLYKQKENSDGNYYVDMLSICLRKEPFIRYGDCILIHMVGDPRIPLEGYEEEKLINL